MTQPDYSLLRKAEYKLDSFTDSWDVFVSAYNSSERVTSVFAAAQAPVKHWLLHPEYSYTEGEHPSDGRVFAPLKSRESDFWLQYFEWAHELRPGVRICFDITGMMRPALMLLVKILALRGYDEVSFVYSDPLRYADGVKTRFAQGAVFEVRQVEGFEGTHSLGESERDLLIIGAGYDGELIRRVAESKRGAAKCQVFGLPSLQHHMYQEGRYRAHAAAESIAPTPESSIFFAPAHDPFETAQVLSELVFRMKQRGFTDVYLSPLATKAQALGFALYFLVEADDSATSVVFPFAPFYTRETSVGVARISVFDLELDWCKCFGAGT